MNKYRENGTALQDTKLRLDESNEKSTFLLITLEKQTKINTLDDTLKSI